MYTRSDNETPGGGGLTPMLRREGAEPCPCAGPSMEPWRRPLLTERKGYRSDGRLGAVQGSWVNRRMVSAEQAGQALYEDTTRGALTAPKADRYGNPRRDTAEHRFDGADVLVIDGTVCMRDGESVWRDAEGRECGVRP